MTDRVASAFLVTLMAVGCLVLWIAIPAGWLWTAGQITSDPAAHIMLSLVGCPLAMVAWAQFLFWLNRLHMRVSLAGIDQEWLDDEDSDEPRWMRGPLESLLVGSLVIAIAALLLWFFLLHKEDPGFF